MKFNFPINNFASGEWSPKMLGRTDTEQYQKACQELQNFIPQMTGGSTYRGGFRNKQLGNIADTYFAARLNPLGVPTFNADVAELISYVPYNTDNSALLLIGPAKWFTVASGTAVEVTYGTSAAASISAGTWGPKNIRYTMLGDYLIMTNTQGTSRPLVFYYSAASSVWRVDMWAMDFLPITLWHRMIPWGLINAQGSGLTLTPSATTGSITITASSAKWASTDVGSYVRFCSGSSVEGVARITGYTSTTVVSATVIRTLPAAGAYGGAAAPTTFWQESIWSDTYGWPRHVVAHEGRLVFGGTATYPDSVWGSRLSNYFLFEEVPSPNTDGSTGFANSAFTADNSRSFMLTPNSPEASNIVGLSSGTTLIIHTQRAEIVAFGSNGALGPVNAVFQSSTYYGAANVQPVRVSNYSTFVQATGRNLRDIIYNSDEEQFKSTDLAFVADHLYPDKRSQTGYSKIIKLAKVQQSTSVLYSLTDQGDLNGITLDRDYKINAWFRVPLGGNGEEDSIEDTNPKVLSITGHFINANTRAFSASVPALYAAVFRVVNGAAILSLEVLYPPWEIGNPMNFATLPTLPQIYLDCAVYATKTSATTWETGPPSPLRNSRVSVVADGNYIGEFDVDNTSSGVITLPREYDNVYAGYIYRGKIKTMPLEQGGQTGTPMGRVKRINEIVIRFFNSLGTSYGVDGDMYGIPFRDNTTTINQGVEYFTGDKVLAFPPGFDRKAEVVIVQDKPYPCHITAIAAQGATYD